MITHHPTGLLANRVGVAAFLTAGRCIPAPPTSAIKTLRYLSLLAALSVPQGIFLKIEKLFYKQACHEQ